MAKSIVTTGSSTLDAWTRGLAGATGAPGGGAAAAVMLSLAAGLMSMVAGYTHPTAETDSAEGDLISERAERLRRVALQLADDDAAASSAFGSAFALPPGADREDAIRQASLIAAESSAIIARHAVDALPDVEWLCRRGNPALIADTTVALAALRAALIGARTNADFDLRAVTNREDDTEARARVPRLSDDLSDVDAAIEHIENLTRVASARLHV